MSHLKTLTNPYQVTMSPADCSLDLGDGSERGEYVDQDYVLNVLGRPHRSINLMYCYYPFDKGWPLRASEAHPPKGDRAWPYPYDDYYPFSGGPQGDTKGPVFEQMRDIRRHGQDVTLTLTMDCKVPDNHIRVIARQLRPFGRLRLRLNHECDGYWFAFNRRYTYGEVAAFFGRFAKLAKAVAPEIQIMSCWGKALPTRPLALEHEKELAPILRAADLWSTDKYITLDYGWPFHRAEPEHLDKYYMRDNVDRVWKQVQRIHRRFCELTGEDKGLELGEFNADGNVGGDEYRIRQTLDFYRRVLRSKPRHLKGITYYQFRDRARLGLEREDPNNPMNGIATDMLPEYKKLIQNPHFKPKENWKRNRGALRMEWRAAEDSDGLGWKVPLKKRPIFLELLLDPKANLMIEAGNHWFYKKPGVEWVDVTAAAQAWGGGKPFPIRLFAPPSEGVNPAGASKVATRLSKPPVMRLHYEWKSKSAKTKA